MFSLLLGIQGVRTLCQCQLREVAVVAGQGRQLGNHENGGWTGTRLLSAYTRRPAQQFYV